MSQYPPISSSASLPPTYNGPSPQQPAQQPPRPPAQQPPRQPPHQPPTRSQTNPQKGTISKDLSRTLIGTTRTILSETYNTAVIGINTGMALAVALAWNESAKLLIKHHVSAKKTGKYQIVYAATITMVAALVFTITQLYFKPSMKRTEVKPVIAVSA